MNGESACRECGRASHALTVEGWCARCDMLISAQASAGLCLLSEYLAKVCLYQRWCADHRVSA